MPTALDRFPSLGAWMMACLGALIFLSGCDGGGTRQASNFQRLVGTWRVQGLEVNGVSGRLAGRDDTLTVTFQSPEANGRHFRVAWMNGSSPDIQGTVELLSPNSLVMTSSQLARPVFWRFDFGALSNDVTFRSAEQDLSSRTFLNAILPEVGWGERQTVTLRLVLRES